MWYAFTHVKVASSIKSEQKRFIHLHRLRRLMDAPPEYQTSSSTSGSNSSNSSNLHPLQIEWIDWVRSEFRLRQSAADEEAIRMALAHGKRQLQEMERTILLARNKNSSSSISSTVTSNSKSGCKTNK